MELFSDLHNKEVLADKLIKIGLLNVKMNFVKLEQKTRIVSHHLKAEIKVLTQQQSDEFLHFFFFELYLHGRVSYFERNWFVMSKEIVFLSYLCILIMDVTTFSL